MVQNVFVVFALNQVSILLSYWEFELSRQMDGYDLEVQALLGRSLIL